jgi:hypothetical protein
MKSPELSEFFSLLGQAKKEKEEEFDNLLKEANVDIDSLVSSTFDGIKKAEVEVKEQKRNEEKLIAQLDNVLEILDEPKVTVGVPEDFDPESLEKLDDDQTERFINSIPLKEYPPNSSEYDSPLPKNPKKKTDEDISDTISKAIKFIEDTQVKEELQDIGPNDPDVDSIKKEVKELRNILYKVLAHGPGSGETRLEFLDDVDRDTAKVNGKTLEYDSASGKWKGVSSSGVGTESSINTSGIITAANLVSTGNVTVAGDLNVTGDISYDEVTGRNLNVTGVSTLAQLRMGSVTATSILDEDNMASNSSIALATQQSIKAYVDSNVTAQDLDVSDGSNAIDIDLDSETLTIAGTSNEIETSASGTTVTIGLPDNVTVSGDLTVGGTLTYEDVTNIDSVGLITAKSGVNVTGGDIKVGSAVTISQDNIFTTGIVTATTFVGNITGNVTGNTSGSSGSCTGNAATATLATNASGLTGYPSITVGTVTAASVILNDGAVLSGVSTTSSTSQTAINTFAAATYRSAKYNIQVVRGSSYQTSEVLVIHDGSNSYGTEYAVIKTGNSLASFDTDINSGNVRLLATPTSGDSTTFKLVTTLTKV